MYHVFNLPLGIIKLKLQVCASYCNAQCLPPLVVIASFFRLSTDCLGDDCCQMSDRPPGPWLLVSWHASLLEHVHIGADSSRVGGVDT